MKKILLVFAIIMTMVIGANAQSDGFFRGGSDDYDGGSRGISNTTPLLPSASYGVGETDNDQPAAPLGSGLLILSALGGAYLFRKKNKKIFKQ